MHYYNSKEQEEMLDPLKDKNRETGFVDHFWDIDIWYDESSEWEDYDVPDTSRDKEITEDLCNSSLNRYLNDLFKG